MLQQTMNTSEGFQHPTSFEITPFLKHFPQEPSFSSCFPFYGQQMNSSEEQKNKKKKKREREKEKKGKEGERGSSSLRVINKHEVHRSFASSFVKNTSLHASKKVMSRIKTWEFK